MEVGMFGFMFLTLLVFITLAVRATQRPSIFISAERLLRFFSPDNSVNNNNCPQVSFRWCCTRMREYDEMMRGIEEDHERRCQAVNSFIILLLVMWPAELLPKPTPIVPRDWSMGDKQKPIIIRGITDCPFSLVWPLSPSAGRRQVSEDMWIFTIQQEQQRPSNRSRRTGENATEDDRRKPPDGLPSYEEAIKLPPVCPKETTSHVWEGRFIILI